MRAPTRVGFFPRGLDGLFVPRHASREAVALVVRGSAEERWARSYLPDGRVAAYAIDAPLSSLSNLEIGARSDLARVLRDAAIDALFLHAEQTPAIRDFARTAGVRVVASPFGIARRLDDKIAFDGFLARQRIPRPRGFVARARDVARRIRARPLVVQRPRSSGGEGTFVVRRPVDLERLFDDRALDPDERCLVRELVDGDPRGVTIFVAPDVLALSAVRRQCFAGGDGRRPFAFAGIQWLPTSELGRREIATMDRVFFALGRALVRARFRGFANVDFVSKGDGGIRVIECNARPSAATPGLAIWPALVSGIDVATGYVDLSLARRRGRTGRAATFGIPTTTFEGSTLDLRAGLPAPTERRPAPTPETGSYRFEGGRLAPLGPDPAAVGPPGTLFLHSSDDDFSTGPAGETVTTIVANVRAYDARGVHTADGAGILAACRGRPVDPDRR